MYDVSSDKIEVIPLSISDEYKKEDDQGMITEGIKKWGVAQPYILYMSNFKFHKNVDSLIRAFAVVAKKHTDLQLVLAGPKEFTYKKLCSLIGSLSLGDKVVFTGRLDQNDRPHLLYSGARVFVFPSLYEGFGIPPAEAMACGVPVVAANRTSVPEVVKDAAILVEPFDIDGMAHAIEQVLNDDVLRTTLSTKGIQYAAEYRKEKIAARTYDLFKRTGSA
jgi:glycosyltransferase involved in cell wall biosynthesis